MGNTRLFDTQCRTGWVVEAGFSVYNTVTMQNVTVYSLPSCSHCKNLKKFFGDYDIQYTEFDVSIDFDMQREMIEKSGQTGAPVIVIGDETVIGYDRVQLKKMLNLK